MTKCVAIRGIRASNLVRRGQSVLRGMFHDFIPPLSRKWSLDIKMPRVIPVTRDPTRKAKVTFLEY